MVVRNNFDLSNYITTNPKLSGQQKADLLANLTGKRKTMLQGSVFMLNHPKLKFDDFENALVALNRANTAHSLGAVEIALQAQIDAIRRMSDKDIQPDEKALCLYSLQNMIFALSDFHLAKDQQNDYVPQILQDQYQMLLRGSNKNLNWDSLNESIYSEQYRDPNNPTLANWRFLDRDVIKQNMDDMMHVKTTGKEMIRENTFPKIPQDLDGKIINGVIKWGDVELNKTPREKINRIIVEAMRKFDTENLKDHLPQFFNFVKDEMKNQNENAGEVSYQVLHEVVLSAMHKFVEIGNDQQKREMLEKSVAQESEGRSL